MPNHRAQRLLPISLVLGGLGLPLAGRGALWESPFWALSAKAEVTAGYDSNLFGIDGGPSDDFATYRPSLLLSRKDSPLTLDTEAWASWTTFDRATGNDSVDPGVRMMLAFPANAPDTQPTQTAEVHWIRSTSLRLATRSVCRLNISSCSSSLCCDHIADIAAVSSRITHPSAGKLVPLSPASSPAR